MSKKIAAIVSGKNKPVLSLTEGPQTPLKLSDDLGGILFFYWRTGLDLKPCHYQHLTPWLKVNYSGDFQAFQKHLEDLPGEEIREKIEMRESLLKVSSIFQVIVGAHRLCGGTQCQECREMFAGVDSDHLKVVQQLISLGADLTARDILGLTPLHYCCLNPTSVTLKIAKCLIEAGADVNVRSR